MDIAYTVVVPGVPYTPEYFLTVVPGTEERDSPRFVPRLRRRRRRRFVAITRADVLIHSFIRLTN